MDACLLLLTCVNVNQAETISQQLLDKKLVVCVKKTPIASSFLWGGEKNHADEIMLLMDSVEENFDEIESEVRKLHSYDTFVLLSLPIQRTTKAVEAWFKKELKDI